LNQLLQDYNDKLLQGTNLRRHKLRCLHMNLDFEWGEEKANANLRKHKVGFEEAKTIFNDPFSITISDPQHSIDEHRFIDIGYSSQERLLVMVYTERESKIRIISCRKAAKSEKRLYEEGKK